MCKKMYLNHYFHLVTCSQQMRVWETTTVTMTNYMYLRTIKY